VTKGFQLFFCNKKNEFTASKRTHHFLMFSASALTVFYFIKNTMYFLIKKYGIFWYENFDENRIKINTF
jgi:hypothetical protein